MHSARFYDPQLGRFIGRDPIGYADGHSLYVAYFVPNGTDPSGLQKSQAPALISVESLDGAPKWNLHGPVQRIRYNFNPAAEGLILHQVIVGSTQMFTKRGGRLLVENTKSIEDLGFIVSDEKGVYQTDDIDTSPRDKAIRTFINLTANSSQNARVCYVEVVERHQWKVFRAGQVVLPGKDKKTINYVPGEIDPQLQGMLIHIDDMKFRTSDNKDLLGGDKWNIQPTEYLEQHIDQFIPNGKAVMQGGLTWTSVVEKTQSGTWRQTYEQRITLPGKAQGADTVNVPSTTRKVVP